MLVRESRPAVVDVAQAHVNAQARAVQRVWRDGRVLQALPSEFEQQSLLWVHAGGLARRDAEERGVELVDILQEPAEARRHPPGCIGIGVEQGFDWPAVGRDIADGVDPAPEELFETLGVLDASRQPQAHADHGDRRMESAFRRLQPAAQRTQVQERALHRRLRITHDGAPSTES